jgi:hypothetical protein
MYELILEIKLFLIYNYTVINIEDLENLRTWSIFYNMNILLKLFSCSRFRACIIEALITFTSKSRTITTSKDFILNLMSIKQYYVRRDLVMRIVN